MSHTAPAGVPSVLERSQEQELRRPSGSAAARPARARPSKGETLAQSPRALACGYWCASLWGFVMLSALAHMKAHIEHTYSLFCTLDENAHTVTACSSASRWSGADTSALRAGALLGVTQ